MAAKSDGEFQDWLKAMIDYYCSLSDEKRNFTIDSMIACSGSSQLSYLYSKTSILLYRDFIKLLPLEIIEQILSYLDGRSLLACCCVNKMWNSVICSSSRVWQNACWHAGLVIKTDLDNADGKYWKSFYHEMTRRLDHMKTYKCFETRKYDRNLRRVTAVYYHKGKVATASDSKIIQIWDCEKHTCLLTIRTDSSIASIKFDNSMIIASSYLGHMVSWDTISGQRLTEYMRHGGAIFSFDFSKDLNLIISGSADFKVKIWALSSGYLYKTLSDHSCWVMKVLLCPYPSGKENTCKDRHLLFSLDKTVIVVRLLNFITSDMSSEGLYITTLYSIPLGRSADMSMFCTGLHFDGQYLYYPKDTVNNQKTMSLCKWDVKQKCMVSEVRLHVNVKALLGVGKKYVVILTAWQHRTIPNLIVLDKHSLERVGFWVLPPYNRPVSPDDSQLCLGEKSWLDGLDGKNDQGVLLTAAIDDNSVYVLKWIPRFSQNAS